MTLDEARSRLELLRRAPRLPLDARDREAIGLVLAALSAAQAELAQSKPLPENP